MTVRLSDALTSIARDPLPFMLTVLLSRALPRNFAFLGGLVAIGFLVSVLRGALRADSAPLPSSRQLPRAVVTGCLAGCGLWTAALFGAFGVMIPLGVLFPHAGEWVKLAAVVPGWWAGQAWFCAGLLAQGGIKDGEHSSKGFLECLGTILKRPPLNVSGLLLLLLGGLTVGSVSLLDCHDAVLQAVPLGLATVYVHCLGQFVRKGLGLELR